MVKRQTSETAGFFGFHDRGVLAAGKKADVNVIDYEALRLHMPEVRYDLPKNGRRLVQRVDGYRATLRVRACRRSRMANTPAPRPAGWCGRRAGVTASASLSLDGKVG